MAEELCPNFYAEIGQVVRVNKIYSGSYSRPSKEYNVDALVRVEFVAPNYFKGIVLEILDIGNSFLSVGRGSGRGTSINKSKQFYHHYIVPMRYKLR